jgi:hypothetical protein
MATQDASLPPNTKELDLSTGVSIAERIRLNTESTINGTPAVRGSIYQQCGNLVGSSWTHPVPATVTRLIQRCTYDSGSYSKGQPKGRPNSQVTEITNINWTPTTADVKQDSWDAGLNYIQFADRTTLFYPDLRSIYPFEDSVLSDSVFVDRMCYVKHIVRTVWTMFVGMSNDPRKLFDKMNKEVDSRINRAFNGEIPSSTRFFQTAANNALGYAIDAEIKVYGLVPNRVWNMTISVLRQDTTTAA